MTVTALGSVTIGAAVPSALTACAAGTAGIGLALPDVEARLAALAAFSPSLGSFSADISLAGEMIVGLQSAVTLGLTPPSISAQLAIIAALIADLTATIVSINAQLSIIVDLTSLFSTAGLFAYKYEGAVNAMGGEFVTAFSGGLPGGAPTDSAHAITLITTAPAAWTAMQAAFKTS